MIEAYPLHWPLGYKRTKSRINSLFKQTPENAQIFLRKELHLMGATKVILSSNVPVRKDGYLYSDMSATKIDDPGVAVYFKYNGIDVSMCCDNYGRPWENIYALGKGIEALRGMERWGVSEFIERAFTGFKALPEVKEWYEILGVNQNAGKNEIITAYRNLVKVHHPDAGGNANVFMEISDAYQKGMSLV
ncbi:MAG TPA: J domain-containing protein [Chitinophagaceae bacterium]|nr:J domain-containing protein [Chitinophagaceae bacterium]